MAVHAPVSFFRRAAVAKETNLACFHVFVLSDVDEEPCLLMRLVVAAVLRHAVPVSSFHYYSLHVT